MARLDYCDVADLLTGKIPTPAALDVQKMVDDAADEMDSYIGTIYQTPIPVGSGSTVSRPAQLTLKRINSHLATGRLIMAVASPEEDRQLHQYGLYLVTEALQTLVMIRDGELLLDGANKVDPTSQDEKVTTPLILNRDAESNVDAFYGKIVNPDYVYPDQYMPWPYRVSGDGLVR